MWPFLVRRKFFRNQIDLMVTLFPSLPHFTAFSSDNRLCAIRLNSAMISKTELETELDIIRSLNGSTLPLYFDIKGRQLRIEEVHDNHGECLDITLNHPVQVETPVVVLFKAGLDSAVLNEVKEDGQRLIFDGGPKLMVRPGESIYIRDPSLEVGGNQFTDREMEKIEQVKKFGFKRYCLSYVENQRDVDEFLELVGKDSDVMLKIENIRGLNYVANEFRKRSNLSLIAARGDLYVEVKRPHDIISALRLIIEHDPEACAGSRLLLSVVTEDVPSCADFSELAWLCDIGYRKFMLCDEICLKEEYLSPAVAAFDEFKKSYLS
jgi:pyruvate kinase